MKLTGDLCGGTLQRNPGGWGTTCTECSLTYSMELLGGMLTGNTPKVHQACGLLEEAYGAEHPRAQAARQRLDELKKERTAL